MTEETLLETLKNWDFFQRRVKALNLMLQEKTFKITASLSADKVTSGYNEVSKIESFCFSRMKIIDERDAILKRLKLCITAYKKANLTPIEKQVIRATIQNESLLLLAKKENMPQAKIYRIRNRAAKKMCIALHIEGYN